MKWIYSLLMLASFLMQACYANQIAKPAKCPDVKYIAKRGIQTAGSSMYGWIGFAKADYLGTSTQWSVMTIGISLDEARSEHQAIKQYNALLSSFKFKYGPSQNSIGNWECLYLLNRSSNSSDLIAIINNPPLNKPPQGYF